MKYQTLQHVQSYIDDQKRKVFRVITKSKKKKNLFHLQKVPESHRVQRDTKLSRSFDQIRMKAHVTFKLFEDLRVESQPY